MLKKQPLLVTFPFPAQSGFHPCTILSETTSQNHFLCDKTFMPVSPVAFKFPLWHLHCNRIKFLQLKYVSTRGWYSNRWLHLHYLDSLDHLFRCDRWEWACFIPLKCTIDLRWQPLQFWRILSRPERTKWAGVCSQWPCFGLLYTPLAFPLIFPGNLKP